MYTRTMGINIHFHSNETTTLALFQCQIRISINRVTIYTFGIFRHTVSMNHTQFIWRSLHSTQIWLKSGVCFVLPTTAISALPTTKGLLTFTMYEKIFPVKQEGVWAGLSCLSEESNISAHCWIILKSALSFCSVCLCRLSSCSVLRYWLEKEKPEV